jgi:hypothetical protein
MRKDPLARRVLAGLLGLPTRTAPSTPELQIPYGYPLTRRVLAGLLGVRLPQRPRQQQQQLDQTASAMSIAPLPVVALGPATVPRTPRFKFAQWAPPLAAILLMTIGATAYLTHQNGNYSTNPPLPVTGDPPPVNSKGGIHPLTDERVSVGCKSDDHFVYAYADWIHDPAGGAEVFGGVCEDHVTHGDYWSLAVKDTAADAKCAHAVVAWKNVPAPPWVTPENEYGMYVCGFKSLKHFYTPVRLASKARGDLDIESELGAFTDGGPTKFGPKYTIRAK